MEIQAHFIKEKVLDGIIHLEYYPSIVNFVDLFIKPLSEAQFSKLKGFIGLVKLPLRGSEVWTLFSDDNFTSRRPFLLLYNVDYVIPLWQVCSTWGTSCTFYTFVVSSLCVKNLLYNFWAYNWLINCIIQAFIWEDLVCAFRHWTIIYMLCSINNQHISIYKWLWVMAWHLHDDL